MPLAETARRVTVHAKHLSHRRGFGRNDGVVSRKPVGHLGDTTHVHRVMIASGQQRRTRGRTQRRGVESVVTKSGARHPIETRCGYGTTERTERTKAHVVENDDENVGCARGWLHLSNGRARGFGHQSSGRTGEWWCRLRDGCHERRPSGSQARNATRVDVSSPVMDTAPVSMSADSVARPVRRSAQFSMVQRNTDE